MDVGLVVEGAGGLEGHVTQPVHNDPVHQVHRLSGALHMCVHFKIDICVFVHYNPVHRLSGALQMSVHFNI